MLDDEPRAVPQPEPEEVESPGAGRHAFLMVTATIVVGILNYALNITLGWSLPVEEYGQVGVSQTLIFVCVWFVSAGFPWVVTRAIAQARGEGPLESPAGRDAWRTYKSAWAAATLLTLAVVALLAASFYLGWLPLEEVYEPLILIVGVTVLALGLGAVPIAALQGLLRFGQVAGVRVFEAAANIAISLALVAVGLGAAGALTGFAAAAVLASVVGVWLLRDRRFWQARGWGGLGALGTAVPMTLAVFGGVLLTNIDLLSIKFLAEAGNSDELSGVYQVAAVLARAPLYVATALVSTFYPRVAQEVAPSGQPGSSPSARKLVRWVVLGVLPLNLVMAVGAPAVVGFFFPERYASAAPILAVLATGGGFLALASALAAILQATHRVAVPAVVMTAAVAIEVLGLWLLVPSYGLVGAAAAAAATSALACALLLWYCRDMNLMPDKPALHAAALTFLALPIALLTLLFGDAGRLFVALWVVGAGALYLAVIFILNLVRAHELGAVSRSPQEGFRGTVTSRAISLVYRLNKLGPYSRFKRH